MKAWSTVKYWKEAGVVTRRGKETICYEIVGGTSIADYQFQKMKITQRIHDGADCYPWRQVFAFLPVKTINGKNVWLQKIYKRRFWAVWGTGFHMEPQVEYATIFDILSLKEE